MEKIILASASPRRKDLLNAAGIAFDVKISSVDEWEPEKDVCPREIVRHNSELKAMAVSAQYPGKLVLGADTTVALGNEILHKPKNMSEAHAMLMKLSGKKHDVYTGFCIARNGKIVFSDVLVSTVVFRHLDDVIVQAYFIKVNPLDKAGAYGIQEYGDMIIDHYEGSLSNIIGLPMETVKPLLERSIAMQGESYA